MQARDDAKFANEHAKNLLESHIFNVRDKLYSDVGQLLSTEEERVKIDQALSEASDWLDDEGWDSTAGVSYRLCCCFDPASFVLFFFAVSQNQSIKSHGQS